MYKDVRVLFEEGCSQGPMSPGAPGTVAGTGRATSREGIRIKRM
jgi:hypothetical protein